MYVCLFDLFLRIHYFCTAVSLFFFWFDGISKLNNGFVSILNIESDRIYIKYIQVY